MNLDITALILKQEPVVYEGSEYLVTGSYGDGTVDLTNDYGTINITLSELEEGLEYAS
ncbi:hypothetical protein H5S09_04065 [Limosilactobacillus sp. STM2_1]|uniref:Uncharacterized protein n=1 Tax=Limosilactobacillus rudii TaxID=2759755 RepID=A0A7W3UKD9_9LACO|nr:hypothetical protein [Limosilactobacillus rudii]MBB1078938.1 hypothetical protein [Limosilactobacillus rudii]MBB1097119.1 hypothetical protein [Limosilactobacillus rudii]MCD7134112.1 hypothetical protein [Limosilactobacillus rudii]